MSQRLNRLVVVAGPTAIGKTAYAIRLAQQLGTEVVSCDSRQFYREMRIGVARPSDDELSSVPHHFIACRSVSEPYNIYDYHHDATAVVVRLLNEHGAAVAVGGSGLYIEALTEGVSRLPDPTPELRSALQQMPLAEKQARLQQLDPTAYDHIDRQNPVRVQRALEVCLTAHQPYSKLIAEHRPATSPFVTEVRVLQTDNTTLRQRIDSRVDQMMADGLLHEAESLLPMRDLPTLRTVGYRELFPVFDGKTALDDAIAQIKLDTWHYARKQLTWLRKETNKPYYHIQQTNII